VLFFEFFPLVLAIFSVIVGFWLYMADRDARNDPSERTPHRVPPPRPPGDTADERGSRRPSMLG
jgi:hypothetical protein